MKTSPIAAQPTETRTETPTLAPTKNQAQAVPSGHPTTSAPAERETTGIEQAAWTGMLAVEDTALAVTDTGGAGIPIVYLNGQFATQGYWRHVIAALGADWRHITFDERARGRSKRSADYSFEAAVRDVDAVLAARGVQRAVVIGWSYGAYVAAHWAARNPERTIGAVLVDGAFPSDWLDEAMEQRIRKLFRRLGWVLPLMRPTGLTPRMTAAQQAESNIELGVISRVGELGPVLNDLEVPTRYVVASGTSFGSKADEQEKIRAGLGTVIAGNPNIGISAKVTSNHGALLKKDFAAIAKAVREAAGLDGAEH
jgi:pimeloyl-ACP methyl ester carboxylesterase